MTERKRDVGRPNRNLSGVAPAGEGAIAFLDLDLPQDKLAAALQVVRAFKGCESSAEWLQTPFSCWLKLEQLEEMLAHRVLGEPLKADTVAALERREMRGE